MPIDRGDQSPLSEIEMVFPPMQSVLTCRPDPDKIVYDEFQKRGLRPEVRDVAVKWLDQANYVVTPCGADDVDRLGTLIEAYRDKLVAVQVTQVQVRSNDHPEANGRHPKAGEQQWIFTVPLETQVRLVLRMGRKGRDALREMILREELDDVADAAAATL